MLGTEGLRGSCQLVLNFALAVAWASYIVRLLLGGLHSLAFRFEAGSTRDTVT